MRPTGPGFTSSRPKENLLQPFCPFHSERPACHATRSQGTSCVVLPSWSVTVCALALAAGVLSQRIARSA